MTGEAPVKYENLHVSLANGIKDANVGLCEQLVVSRALPPMLSLSNFSKMSVHIVHSFCLSFYPSFEQI